MNRIIEDSVRLGMEELKELYAQLFILMDQMLGDEQDDEAGFEQSEGLDSAIGSLMRHIEGKFQSFQEMAEPLEHPSSGTDLELVHDLGSFRTDLHAGLAALYQRIVERGKDLESERDRTRDLLKQLGEKNRTRRAYRGPGMAVSSLLSNEV